MADLKTLLAQRDSQDASIKRLQIKIQRTELNIEELTLKRQYLATLIDSNVQALARHKEQLVIAEHQRAETSELIESFKE